MDVTCPSGLAGRVRGFKVQEVAMLSDRQLTRSGDLLTKIYQNCWLETTDPGPYPFADSTGILSKPNWDLVLLGDRLHLLLELRRTTHGDDYDFDLQCVRCQKRVPISVKLSDFPRKTPSPSLLRHVREGTPFRTECDGRAVDYRLLVGKDERFQATLAEQTAPQRILNMAARRIVEVEGVGTEFRKIREWLSNVDAADYDRLQDEMDDVEGGIDTTVQAICVLGCGWEALYDLPFETNFFTSQRRFSRSARRMSGAD